MPLSSLSDSPTMKMKAAVSLVVIKFLPGYKASHLRILFTKALFYAICVPEEVGVNQK